MARSCPISLKRVDSITVRIGSFVVFTLTLLFVVTGTPYIPLLLTVDFALRLYGKEEWSIVSRSAHYIARKWKTTPRYTDEAPKRFAMTLGFFLVASILVASLTGASKSALFLSAVLLLCGLAEILFDFCIGCKIYYGLKLTKVIKDDRNFD